MGKEPCIYFIIMMLYGIFNFWLICNGSWLLTPYISHALLLSSLYVQQLALYTFVCKYFSGISGKHPFLKGEILEEYPPFVLKM